MKKILFLIPILLLCSLAQAQVAMTNPNGLALDTVANTTPEACTVQLKGFQETASFTLLVTKISGTVGGTAVLQGSNQVSKGYATIDTTQALADATQTLRFWDVPKKFLYYRILITGTGTMSASYSAAAYVTKE